MNHKVKYTGKGRKRMKKKNIALITALGAAGSLLAAVGVYVYLKVKS